MIVTSIDIGKKNFDFSVEYFDENEIKSKKGLYDVGNGKLPRASNELLEWLYGTGETLIISKHDITNGSKEYFSTEYLKELTRVLDEYKNIWMTVDVVLIEEQVNYARRSKFGVSVVKNTMAIALAHHCLSYFSIFYPDIEVRFFSSTFKTNVLCAPLVSKEPSKDETTKTTKTKKTTKTLKPKMRKLNDSERKKWAIEEAIRVLGHQRKRFSSIERVPEIAYFDQYERFLKGEGKKPRYKLDDDSDTILMTQCFKILRFLSDVL